MADKSTLEHFEDLDKAWQDFKDALLKEFMNNCIYLWCKECFKESKK